MEERDFRIVVALHETRNFGRTAAYLGVDISTISRRISRIEDDLGVTIFERSRSGVRVTNAGTPIVKQFRRALFEIDTLKTMALSNGRGKQGEIRFATQISILTSTLREWIRAWRAIHPRVDLTLFEWDDRTISSSLSSRQIDLAILLILPTDMSLNTIHLFQERFFLAVPDGHALAGCRAIKWDDLSSERLLVRCWESSQAYRDMQAKLVGSGVEFRSHNASYLALLGLVAIGEGLALVLESHAYLGIPGVSFIPVAEPDAEVPIWLAWALDIEDPVVGSFVAFMRDRAQSRPLRPASDFELF